MAATISIRIVGDAARLRNELRRTEAALLGFDSLSKRVFRTGIQAAGIFGVALGNVAAFGLRTAADLEQIEVGFTNILGSGVKAERFMGELAEFAKTTPFEFQGLARSASTMAAYGIETKRIIPLLNAMGDATAAAGSGQAGLTRSQRALNDVLAKGRLQGQEVLQFTNAGIPIMQAVAAELGVTLAEAEKLKEAGDIGSDVVLSAFENYSGEFLQRVQGTLVTQSETLAGVVQNLKETFQLGLAAGLEPARDELKTLLGGMREDMDSLIGEFAPQLNDFVIEGAKVFEAALPGIIEGAGLAAEYVTEVFEALQEVGDNFADVDLSGAFDSLLDSIGPVTEMIGSIGATFLEFVGPAAEGFFEAWEKLAPAVQEVAEAAAPIAEIFGDLFGEAFVALAETFAEVLTEMAPALEELTPAFEDLAEALKPVIEALADAGSDVLIALLESLVEILPSLIELLEAATPLIVTFLEAFTPVAVAGIEALAEVLETVADGLADLIDWLRELEGLDLVAMSFVFGGLAFAIAGLAAAAGIAATNLGLMAGGLTAILIPLGKVLLPFLLVGAAIAFLAAAAVWAYENIEEFRVVVDAVVDEVVPRLEELKDVAVDTFENIAEWVKSTYEDWRGQTDDLIEATQRLIDKIGEELGPKMEEGLLAAQEFVDEYMPGMQAAFEDLGDAVGDLLTTLGDMADEFAILEESAMSLTGPLAELALSFHLLMEALGPLAPNWGAFVDAAVALAESNTLGVIAGAAILLGGALNIITWNIQLLTYQIQQITFFLQAMMPYWEYLVGLLAGELTAALEGLILLFQVILDFGRRAALGLVLAWEFVKQKWEELKQQLEDLKDLLSEVGIIGSTSFGDIGAAAGVAAGIVQSTWSTALSLVSGQLVGLSATGITSFGQIGLAGQTNAMIVQTAWTVMTGVITGVWSALVGVLTGIASRIATGVIGEWERIETFIRNMDLSGAASAAWESLVSVASGIAGRVNAAFSAIRVPTLGGLGATVGRYVGGRLARLASGAVLYDPTLALVGEYAGARMNPEIVTPERLMRQIVRQELSRAGGSGRGGFHIENLYVPEGRDTWAELATLEALYR